MDSIDELLLETLSFYTPMIKEEIILDLDLAKLEEHESFSLIVLEEKLDQLVKKNYLTRKGKGNDTRYLRILPSSVPWYKKMWQKIFS